MMVQKLSSNFYKNRSTFAEVMTKEFWCFLCPTLCKWTRKI